MAAKVHAVALGKSAAATAESLCRHGVDLVHVSEDAVFDDYLVDPHVEVLKQILDGESVSAVVLADTGDSKDVAARLAARLGGGLRFSRGRPRATRRPSRRERDDLRGILHDGRRNQERFASRST